LASQTKLLDFFDGTSSDAGGGFTGKAMKKALVAEKLADVLLYIHINCTSHNDQTNLCVLIKKVYGAGGRDKRNVCQLIQAISDTQQLFEKGRGQPHDEKRMEVRDGR
jgi:hypothetical protein